MPSIERRAVISSMLSLTALPLLQRRARGGTDTDPPVFRTTRHQYTLIEPSRLLPETTLSDLAGRPRRVASTPGRVFLIDVWATWCEACRVDLPLLDRFHQTSAARVMVAAISTDTRDRQYVKRYVDGLSIRSLPIYLDPDGRLASNAAEGPAPLSIVALPVTYLVTPSGRVAGYIQGTVDWLADDAQNLLAYYASR